MKVLQVYKNGSWKLVDFTLSAPDNRLEELGLVLQLPLKDIFEIKNEIYAISGNTKLSMRDQCLINCENSKITHIPSLQTSLAFIFFLNENKTISRDVLKETFKIENNVLNKRICQLRQSLRRVDSNLRLKTKYRSGFYVSVAPPKNLH